MTEDKTCERTTNFLKLLEATMVRMQERVRPDFRRRATNRK